MPWLIQTPPAVQDPALTHLTIWLPENRKFKGPDHVEMWAKTATIDADKRTYHLRKGVIVQYGLTVIKAGQVDIDSGEFLRISATETVQILDPLFSVDADSVTWRYEADGRHGSMLAAQVRIGRAVIHAKSVAVEPGEWSFKDAWGSSCWDKPQLYSLSAKEFIVRTGDEAVAKSLGITVLGHHIITIPERTVNLDPNGSGQNIPLLGWRRGAGIGAEWNNAYVYSNSTRLNVGAAYYPSFAPAYNVSLTKSLIPASSNQPVLTTQTDMGQRFRYGYFERVDLATPKMEMDYLQKPRNAVSIGASLNETTNLGLSTEVFSKLADLVYERGGKAGPGAFLITSRFEIAREARESARGRSVLRATYVPGHPQIRKGLWLVPRVEYGGFYGTGLYEWFMLNLGFRTNVNEHIAIAANGFATKETGTPQFVADRLFSKNGFDCRLDLQFGGTYFSIMERWDRDLKWFEPEFKISQVTGCVQPFLIYHRFTHDFRIGVKMRLEDVFTLFKDRNDNQSGSGVTISSPGRP